MGIGIGRLRHRVTVLQQNRTEGPMGPTETWTEVETLWAAVLALKFSARVKWQQFAEESMRRLVFRGVKEWDFKTLRFRWEGKLFKPVSAEWTPDQKRRWTTVIVRELTEEQ